MVIAYRPHMPFKTALTGSPDVGASDAMVLNALSAAGMASPRNPTFYKTGIRNDKGQIYRVIKFRHLGLLPGFQERLMRQGFVPELPAEDSEEFVILFRPPTT